jgi:hypothetical protein
MILQFTTAPMVARGQDQFRYSEVHKCPRIITLNRHGA